MNLIEQLDKPPSYTAFRESLTNNQSGLYRLWAVSSSSSIAELNRYSRSIFNYQIDLIWGVFEVASSRYDY